ncbi:isopenicillin N synthase family oxygenase [Leptolyngbya sp. FACHB-261]|uniref:isopenicillin N synthase family dioxygenase n=1 Tax=Leptolyngbya sp. FACHB-261 TaxID=2692806 RepID=UPI00168305A7|nr:isopenicillin N synthase family oxygenase [Leptolyngbya sp. FACHB-261]MBD2102584.1 isopenicillin N synthase family oxygenase [Leptolyngbya sp. FACHB-261]
MTAQTIPVLNLQAFKAGSDSRAHFVTALGEALRDTGFFAVTQHGVNSELIRSAYQAAQAFFELPEVVKRKYERPELNGQRGFTRFGREHAKDHPVPDLKEFWHVGREDSTVYPANLWPNEISTFQVTLSELYRQLEGCAQALLAACSLYLEESQNFLPALAEEGNSILRIIHYPSIPPDAHPLSLRAAPHEDINLLTLLCEATEEGLELLQRDGSWLAIPALPGQIIVDAGDMLQQLTNGLLKSTTHRVTNPTGLRERRFSMPFFIHPRPEVDLTPLPQCVAATGGQAKFPQITAGQYLEKRLREIGLAPQI